MAKAPSSAQLETVIHEDVSEEDLFSVSIEPLYKHSGYTKLPLLSLSGLQESWRTVKDSPVVDCVLGNDPMFCSVLFFCKHTFLRFVPAFLYA